MKHEILVHIIRPNGELEIVDVTKNFANMTDMFFAKITEATKKAGKGDVIRAEEIIPRSNLNKLEQNYNNLHNEGGEGYIPDVEYFKKLPQYKEWVETKVWEN